MTLSNTVNWTAGSFLNLTWNSSAALTPLYATRVAQYIASVNTQLAVTPGSNALVCCNPQLNFTGAPPAAFAVTGGGAYCQGSGGLPVGLSGSQVGVNYTLTPGGDVVPGNGGAITFGNKLAGTYTVSGTADGTVSTIVGTTPMTGSAIITETPASTVDVTASACDTYTWALNGQTYTASGNYTYVVGCVTNILHLTITPSGTNEFTASACDSYTWAVNGITYTVSGNYTFVNVCSTNILHLTITPSSTVDFTASACDTYTWGLNGATYTASGNYTYVVGCVTNILHLTITPSSTVEATVSACETYTWALNGSTYTVSGNYTYVVGCVTNILHLTINTPAIATFTQLGPYAQGATPGVLPLTSLNGISGTWSPATISTVAFGSFVFNFTPAAGQCGLPTSMTVIINPGVPATATWNGSVSSDWFTAGNWTTPLGNLVPGATTVVTIPGGVTNSPTLTSNTTVAGLTILNGGSFIGAEFLNLASATVICQIPNTKAHFLSAPVSGAKFGPVFGYSLNTWARWYNPMTGLWEYKTALNPFGVGTGYNVSTTNVAGVTATFVGPLNKTDVSSTLSSANGGWNLLGNPFQSAIAWNGVVKGAGVSATVSVWNGTTYLTYNGTVGSLPGGIIPAENGFFVTTTINASTLTVPLAARQHSTVPFYKESVTNALRVDAIGNDLEDATFVHFNNDATAGYDNQLDGVKLMSEDMFCPQIYNVTAGQKLSINELPLAGNETVNLGFSCKTDGNYNLSASGIESFDATTTILLEDTKLNITQDLRSNSVYSFSYVTGEDANRFVLHFKAANSIAEPTNSGIAVYSYDHNVMINNTTGLAGEVWVYDMTGRELTHTTMNSQMTTSIPMQAAIGTYLVKVVTAKATVNHKVFIR